MNRLRIRDERGFTMIEAIVSATLLVIVALGVLRGLDTAQRSSGREKARSAAAALTEQDQERLRSFRAVDLANYDEEREVWVGKVKYTVQSQVDWVRDSTGGTESCNSNTQQADYMRVTSTTTSHLINTPIPPIRMSSLVAPPVGAFGANQGTLGVQVNNRNGVGVPGMPVTISGPTNVSNPTNSAGCAIFAYVPAGTYTARVNSTGWVDPGGNENASVGATVTAGTVKVASIAYDKAASVDVTFDTEPRDSTLAEPVNSMSLSASNTGVPAGPLSLAGMRFYRPTGGPHSMISATGLFPFADGYGLYGGSCPGADPTDFNASFYETFPQAHVDTEPGEKSPDALVRLPSINMKVTYNGTLPITNPVRLTFTSKSSGCTEKFVFEDAVDLTTGLMKKEYAPLPFGDYQVCASTLRPGTTSSYRFRQTPNSGPHVQNRRPEGNKPATSYPSIDIPTSSTFSGQCSTS
jgi:type II secretory pathway pseudopilin PulG